jgi:lipopolysaccharide export LptBFGC system permease protein LptF
VGAPLGALFRQKGRMAGMTVGLGVFLAYYIALSAGKGLGENGLVSPLLAVWLPNFLTTLVVILLWRKVQREIPPGMVRLFSNWHLPWQKTSVIERSINSR